MTFASTIEIPTAPHSIDADDEREKFTPNVSAFGAHHLYWLECLQKVEDGEIKRLMGLMPPGSGKALALNTPIPTPAGWTSISELKIGDQVFDERGLACNVTWVSPIWKDRPVYKISTDCGDAIIADENHEWLVKLCRKPGRKFKLKSSKELASHRRFGKGGVLIEKPRAKRPLIKRAAPLELGKKEYPLDPYLLGAWLGDGSSYHPCVTCGEQDLKWFENEFRLLGIEVNTYKNGSAYSLAFQNIRYKFQQLYLIDGGSTGRVQGFKNKHIPMQYLRGSKEQRLALLQGLIDTDGYIAPNGMVEFSNTNRNIAYGVAELVRSLGAKASIVERQITFEGRILGPGWRVYFYLKNAARLPRKAILTRDGTRTPDAYVDVVPFGKADTICIEVDSESHLFLCGASMLPTHNSVYSSVVFPTHFLGRFPKRSIIVASYGSDLPRKFGRRARSIVTQPMYKRIFDTSLSEESAAVDEWALTNGSEWMAKGILTGITGNRVDGIIWDDLIKGREQADSKAIRDKTWDAYMDDLQTRRKPSTFEVGITCMVGGTQVLMRDGTYKNLQDIKRGDLVASYDGVKVISSKVLNWRNCGLDNVFTMKTTSGILVSANARHPFLIERKGKIAWVRLKNIIVGDRALRVIGENGKTLDVRNVKSQPKPVDFATSTMGNGDGERGYDPHRTIMGRYATAIYDIVMGLIGLITKQCLKPKRGLVQFAKKLNSKIPLIGGEAFALTTATVLEKCVGSFATPVTTWSEKGLQWSSCKQQLNTYEVIVDEITSITPAGREDVFDIEVEHTANFIANGVISHNTRWHEDDPAGRILPPDYDGASGLIKCQDGNDWYVVCLPAIAERDDDPLGRKPGDILWPEWFTEQHFAPFKRNPRSWSALFQQRPAPDTGDYFESAWLVPYSRPIDPPSPIEQPRRETLTVYGASDYAVTADGGDYTVHVVVGIDPTNRVFLLDLWRKQASADKWIEAFCDMVERWRPIGWAEETGQIKSGIGPFLVKRLRERRLYLARAQFSPKGDKAIRAQSIRGRMAMDGLYVPIFAPWYPDLRRELLSFPAGKHDDQCLVSGTLIKMADGRDLPIETVKEGDIVATPCGPKRVLASKKTNAAAQVYKVLFSNGQHLISTGGHPIYVHKKGFVPVDALGIMDRVEPFKEHDLCVEVGRLKLHHQLSIMGIVTGFMKGVHIMRHHHHGLAIYIDMFGKILTVQFQKIVTYTTLMKTQQIITQTILNVLRRPNTEESIQCLVPAWNGSGHIWLEYGHWPMLGIKPKQDVNRCGGPQSLVGLIGRRLKKSVNVVNKNLKQLLKQEVDAVPEPVVSVSGLVVLTERMAVHNLTVEDAHVYYANGILTHNCDALGLIGQILDKMVSGKMLAPEPEKPKVLSTDPTTCTVTLTDMFEAHEKRGKYHVSRIH